MSDDEIERDPCVKQHWINAHKRKMDCDQMTKLEWINIRPGILAIKGTPMQIRREAVRTNSGSIAIDNVYCIYEDENFRTWVNSLISAKRQAITFAQELIEMGLCEDTLP